MKQFSPFQGSSSAELGAQSRSHGIRRPHQARAATRCADYSHVQFQSKKVLEREGRRQQLRIVAVCIRPVLTTGIPLLPPQRHPDLPIQCFPSKLLPPEAESASLSKSIPLLCRFVSSLRS